MQKIRYVPPVEVVTHRLKTTILKQTSGWGMSPMGMCVVRSLLICPCETGSSLWTLEHTQSQSSFSHPSFVLVSGFCCFLFCLFNFHVPLSFSIQMLKIIFIFFGTLPITDLRSGSSDITPSSSLPEYQRVSSVFIPVCHATWFLKVDNKLSLVTTVP